MSDIDFDELDRAVASVLNGPDTHKPTATPASATGTTVPVSSPAPDVSDAPQPSPSVQTDAEPIAVTVTTPVAATASTTTAVPVSVPAQALHAQLVKPVQRGRFLDMVHPSQDMTTKSAAATTPSSTTDFVASPPAPAANQTFVSDVIAPVVQTPPASEPDPALAPISAPASSVSTPLAEPQPVAPQPIDGLSGEALPADFFADEDDKATEPASPFIADAKVEKRPLGAFSSEAANVTLPEGDDLHARLVQVESEDNVVETAESPIPTAAPIAPFATPKPTAIKEPEAVAKAEPAATPAFSLFDHDEPAPVPKKVKQPKAPKPAKPAKQPKPQAEKAPKYGKGTLIWVTVFVAVLLIGFGVGATLYLYVLR